MGEGQSFGRGQSFGATPLGEGGPFGDLSFWRGSVLWEGRASPLGGVTVTHFFTSYGKTTKLGALMLPKCCQTIFPRRPPSSNVTLISTLFHLNSLKMLKTHVFCSSGKQKTKFRQQMLPKCSMIIFFSTNYHINILTTEIWPPRDL